MNRPIRWHDYITININWFAIITRSQVLAPLVIPLLVQQFIGEESKGTYVGILRLWTLMAALLFQAFMGLLSDHSTSRWGRRRPFIFFGALFEIVVVLMIGFTAGMEGQTGYWIFFVLIMLSMLGSNSAHAATQALIPDLVPAEKKGMFSGVKAALELPVPLIFVSFVVGRMIAAGNLWGGLIALCVVLFVCMAITMFAPEQPLKEKTSSLDWNPFLRLAMMTGAFTLIILAVGEGVQWFVELAGRLPTSSTLILVGFIGVFGMLFTVLLGVWVSVRISIGSEIKDQGSFTWWVVNRLSFMIASTNLSGFMVFFLQEKFPELVGEKAAGPAATIIMFVGIFILLVTVPSGWLADKFGKKLLITVAGLSVAGGTAVVVTAPGLSAIYVGACFVGAGVGLFYSANWALGTEIVPKERAGHFLGIQNIAGAGAGAVGAYIGGTIADNMSYVLLMSIYGVMALISIFPLLGIKKS
jgi:MFS family permease